jgi:hypothetical protein
MGTIQSYRKFIKEYESKIWDIFNNEIVPSIKEILDSYDEIHEYSIRIIDREYNTRDSGDIETCFLFIRLFPENKEEDFSKIARQIMKRIKSEFKDDIYLVRGEFDVHKAFELIYSTLNDW